MKVCLLLLLIPSLVIAQNRYDTPASASFMNTYTPMSYNDMLLTAAAMALKEKQDQENFDKCSTTAYEYLKKNQLRYFIAYANAALNTGYYTNQLYYNLGISHYLLGQKRKGKRFFKKASKKGFVAAGYALSTIKKKEVISNKYFIF